MGDLEKPKLVFFFDEAHLLFDDATEAFLDSVAQTVRLIRSKGVGMFFVTQIPKDLPSEVLGQLGYRVQHALRAFTPEDAKALKATVSTYPKSEFYDLEELLAQMGIGEAAVTVLSDRGVPTPVVHTRLAAPAASMGPAPDVEGAAKASALYARYGERLDNPSARELLEARLTQARAAAADAGRGADGARAGAKARASPRPPGRAAGRRRLPALARGPAAPAQGAARRVRDAAQAAVEPVTRRRARPER